MAIVQIFYCSFWISAFSVIWFYTDWLLHYIELFGFANSLKIKYLEYISLNPNKFFPDFLYEQSLEKDNRFVKFISKLVSCPVCLMAFLSIFSSILCLNFLLAAPIYIISLFIVLKIKNYV